MSNTSPDVQGFAFNGDGHQTAKQTVKVIRTGLIIGAILSALFGVLILTATGQVLEVVAVLFGIYFIIGSQWIISKFNYPCRISSNDRIVRHIFCDNCTGSDYCTISNLYSR